MGYNLTEHGADFAAVFKVFSDNMDEFHLSPVEVELNYDEIKEKLGLAGMPAKDTLYNILEKMQELGLVYYES